MIGCREARSRRPTKVRTSTAAGGVVTRGAGDELEVVLTGRTSDGTWVFPKGTPDAGESIEETALREVQRRDRSRREASSRRSA